MTARLDLLHTRAGATVVRHLVAAVQAVAESPLPRTVQELVKIRVSQINGCAFCVDMHSQDALANGESSRRLFAVAAWREAPFFTARERAALALTDEVTRLGEAGVTDQTWEEARKVWSEEEIAHLLLAIATINVWNRLAVATRMAPPTA